MERVIVAGYVSNPPQPTSNNQWFKMSISVSSYDPKKGRSLRFYNVLVSQRQMASIQGIEKRDFVAVVGSLVEINTTGSFLNITITADSINYDRATKKDENLLTAQNAASEDPFVPF